MTDAKPARAKTIAKLFVLEKALMHPKLMKADVLVLAAQAPSPSDNGGNGEPTVASARGERGGESSPLANLINEFLRRGLSA